MGGRGREGDGRGSFLEVGFGLGVTPVGGGEEEAVRAELMDEEEVEGKKA